MKVGPWQETNGDWSIRRILATLCFILSFVLSYAALPYAEKGWWVFIPAGLYVLSGILLILFTTWEAVKGILVAAKELKG
jgi:hypothetical protein